MKRSIWSVAVVMLVLMIALIGCTGTPKVGVREKKQTRAQVVQKGTSVTVKTAADWATDYPDIYASYLLNKNNSENYNYPDKYTMLKVVYQGMAFNEFYKSARGHVYTVEDLRATGRPHPLANCFTCKTPNFTAAAIERGAAAYTIPFAEMDSQVTEPVSCYNCHADDPNTLTVTHTYLSDALGQDVFTVEPTALACAQCHVEYYFDPATRAVTLPYKSLATMNPDAMLAYYNEINFADYTNPRTGVRQIKIQHPEFETYRGEGGLFFAMTGKYACADCHMPTRFNANKEAYTHHEWGSPLNNASLIKNECSQCHRNIASEVKRIQDQVHGRSIDIGKAIEAFTEDLAAKIAGGSYTDAQLAPVRQTARDAQFYWDFVWVENSNGAHSKKLSNQCLDKAEALLNEAKSLLTSL